MRTSGWIVVLDGFGFWREMTLTHTWYYIAWWTIGVPR